MNFKTVESTLQNVKRTRCKLLRNTKQFFASGTWCKRKASYFFILEIGSFWCFQQQSLVVLTKKFISRRKIKNFASKSSSKNRHIVRKLKLSTVESEVRNCIKTERNEEHKQQLKLQKKTQSKIVINNSLYLYRKKTFKLVFQLRRTC